jgi:hypothetical protein
VQALECFDEGVGEIERLLVFVYIGSGWIIGCGIFGFLAMQRNEDCRISKLYLCQVGAHMKFYSKILCKSVRGLARSWWIE